MKVVWVSTWNNICGIADYSRELWPAIEKSLVERGDMGSLVSIDQYSKNQIVTELKKLSPDIVHFQHEFGLFGGKNPPFYTFPSLISELKSALPNTKFVATAHTVISERYHFPVKGKGWQIPLRGLANIFLLKKLREYWGPKTWGKLDGTIIHSDLQSKTVTKAGSTFVTVVPHFVPAKEKIKLSLNRDEKTVLVFGFFTPEKGQDVVIEAFRILKNEGLKINLVLAGGVRRAQDTKYFEKCKKLISDYGLQERVTTTGYIKAGEVQKYLEKADLVVAPFRETTGSGSLAQVLARGLPLLASDLPLNREINDRESGCLELFKSGDAKDLAKKITHLIYDEDHLKLLRQGAFRYASHLAPVRVAFQHLHIYDQLRKGDQNVQNSI
jgi:1,2-diacylglycerol 3-alpha-glucosyltransferase